MPASAETECFDYVVTGAGPAGRGRARLILTDARSA
jgi:hypothetical protein